MAGWAREMIAMAAMAAIVKVFRIEMFPKVRIHIPGQGETRKSGTAW